MSGTFVRSSFISSLNLSLKLSLKLSVLVVLFFSCLSLAQDAKPGEPQPGTPPDNSAFVIETVTKGTHLQAAIKMMKAKQEGQPTAQLYHVIGTPEASVEAWLVTQKVKGAEAPIGRELLHLMVYLDVQKKDADGKDLEKPVIKVRAIGLGQIGVTIL